MPSFIHTYPYWYMPSSGAYMTSNTSAYRICFWMYNKRNSRSAGTMQQLLNWCQLRLVNSTHCWMAPIGPHEASWIHSFMKAYDFNQARVARWPTLSKCPKPQVSLVSQLLSAKVGVEHEKNISLKLPRRKMEKHNQKRPAYFVDGDFLAVNVCFCFLGFAVLHYDWAC